MKVIFLDIDGVLNHKDAPSRGDSIWLFDEDCLAHFAHIIKETGAKVVISSSWRHSKEGLNAIEEAFKRHDIPKFIDKTPGRGDDPRAARIKQWLCGKENIEAFAILDDDEDASFGLAEHFFRTSWDHGGLSKNIARAVIEYLI